MPTARLRRQTRPVLLGRVCVWKASRPSRRHCSSDRNYTRSWSRHNSCALVAGLRISVRYATRKSHFSRSRRRWYFPTYSAYLRSSRHQSVGYTRIYGGYYSTSAGSRNSTRSSPLARFRLIAVNHSCHSRSHPRSSSS